VWICMQLILLNEEKFLKVGIDCKIAELSGLTFCSSCNQEEDLICFIAIFRYLFTFD
jgi:hypothetical protein